MSAQSGADGTTIAGYDTAIPVLRRAVRESFEEAGIQVAAPRPARAGADLTERRRVERSTAR